MFSRCICVLNSLLPCLDSWFNPLLPCGLFNPLPTRPGQQQERGHYEGVESVLHRLNSESEPAAPGEHCSLGQLQRTHGPLSLPDLRPDTHGDRGGDVPQDGPPTGPRLTQRVSGWAGQWAELCLEGGWSLEWVGQWAELRLGGVYGMGGANGSIRGMMYIHTHTHTHTHTPHAPHARRLLGILTKKDVLRHIAEREHKDPTTIRFH